MMRPQSVSDGLALLDPLLAFASTALFAVMAILAIRDVRRSPQGRLLILVLLSQLGLAVTRFPDAQSLPMLLLLFARLAGLANLGFLWWFCLSLLRDDFRIGAPERIGFIALAAVPCIYLAQSLGIAPPYAATIDALGDIPPVAMVIHLAWVAVSERGGDLVEPRRRARLWLAFAPLAALLVALVTEAMDDARLASVLRNGLGILPAQLVLFFWLANMPPERLSFTQAARPLQVAPRIDPRDIAMHVSLTRAMQEERIYLRHGLTITGLAETLGVPPHQLRHLINAGMGFRNFSAFLNTYRLAHAKEALADISRARETVLAICYESGFASLQSFNRVFRQVEGQTPTSFRTAALARHAQA